MVFSGVVIAPGVCHPGLEEGLYFTDGRADVSVLLGVFDYRTWFQCLRKGVECGKQSLLQCPAGFENKEIYFLSAAC